MSTKVKVGIAAVIVAALVALIVLDQKTTSQPESRTPAAANDGAVTISNPVPVGDAPTLMRDKDVDKLLKDAEQRLGGNGTKEPKVEKGTKELPPAVKDKPAGEEYVVVENDSFEKIAKNKLGSAKYAGLIAEANPTVKASALRVGQKLLLPPKPEPKSEAAKSDAPKEEQPKEAKEAKSKVEPAFSNKDGQRIYTVQAGDTLSGISVKVYNTSRYVEKIVEANKIDDPSTLWVGMKLVMPDLPKKEGAPVAASGSGTVKTSSPSGGKSYTVQPGENLWKIASKIAGDRGIEETMRMIVSLNPDKLKSIGDAIRSGWQLVMPE